MRDCIEYELTDRCDENFSWPILRSNEQSPKNVMRRWKKMLIG